MLRIYGHFQWNRYGVVAPLYLRHLVITDAWDVAMGVIKRSECGKREGREERRTCLWTRIRNQPGHGTTVGQRLPLQSL